MKRLCRNPFPAGRGANAFIQLVVNKTPDSTEAGAKVVEIHKLFTRMLTLDSEAGIYNIIQYMSYKIAVGGFLAVSVPFRF